MSTPQTEANKDGAATGLALATSSVIYATGCTPDGVTLIGGIWKLWEQEGFPLEMSHLICRDKGWAVDWLEAMADASCTHNCPALVKHIEAFLPDETMTALKLGFMRVLNSGKTYEQIVAEKQANCRAFEDFIRAALTQLSSQNNAVSGAALPRSL
jgi:hypothetical protein